MEPPLRERFRVIWVLNAACPSRCSYCAIETQRTQRPLPRERVVAAAHDLVACGFSEVIFVGGEPLLSPDLPAALEALGGRCDVAVFTGGIPGDIRRPLDVLRRGVNRLVASLDAGDEAANDKLRGRDGITRDLTRLVEATRRELPAIDLSVNSVVTRHNVDRVASAWERAEPWRPSSWSLTLAGDNFDGRAPEGHFLDRAQVETHYLEHVPRLASLLAASRRELVVLPVPLPFLTEELPPRLWNLHAARHRAALDEEFDRYARGDYNTSFVTRHGCPLIGTDISIGVDGSVFPCSQAPVLQPRHALGSLVTDRLADLLSGERLRAFRAAVPHAICHRCHAPSNVQRPALRALLRRPAP
jgi:sulfatase maturation enzyme AslB (radical SAM superfamily)